MFRDSLKSAEIIRNGIDTIKGEVNHVNKGQNPATSFDQLLHTLEKQVQWNWKGQYEEENIVIMIGPFIY